MPLYTYECACGRVFDRLANVDDEPVKLCTCYRLAKRREVNSVAMRVGGATIPNNEPEYQNEKSLRDLNRQGWDGDRAVEHIRKNVREDGQGNKYINPQIMV